MLLFFIKVFYQSMLNNKVRIFGNSKGGVNLKLVRFSLGNEEHCGILKGEKIQFVAGNIFDFKLKNELISVKEVTLLTPCVPTKAVCVGLNYHDHAREMNEQLPKEPLVFLKPSSCLNHPFGNIEYPEITKNLHYEAELAIVIKKQAKKVPKEQALEYVLGYTCANDVTARDLQKSDGQWTRGKSFDTFLPLGPCIETNIDPNNIPISLTLNGQVKQKSNTSNLIFKVPELIEFITKVMTLYPGDVILTGTPSGVGPMQHGDVVKVTLEGIGTLQNTIS